MRGKLRAVGINELLLTLFIIARQMNRKLSSQINIRDGTNYLAKNRRMSYKARLSRMARYYSFSAQARTDKRRDVEGTSRRIFV